MHLYENFIKYFVHFFLANLILVINVCFGDHLVFYYIVNKINNIHLRVNSSTINQSCNWSKVFRPVRSDRFQNFLKLVKTDRFQVFTQIGENRSVFQNIFNSLYIISLTATSFSLILLHL